MNVLVVAALLALSVSACSSAAPAASGPVAPPLLPGDGTLPGVARFHLQRTPQMIKPATADPSFSAPRMLQRLVAGGGPKQSLAVSPLGTTILYETVRDSQWGTRAVELKTPQVESFFVSGGHAATWLRDGSGFTYNDGKRVFVLQLSDRVHPIELVRFAAPPVDQMRLRVSPKGDALMFAHSDRDELSFVSGATGVEQRVTTASKGQWSADGERLLLIANSDGKASLTNPGAPTEIVDSKLMANFESALSPDSAFVAFLKTGPSHCIAPHGNEPVPMVLGETQLLIGRLSDGASFPIVNLGNYAHARDLFWGTDGFVYFVAGSEGTEIWRVRPGPWGQGTASAFFAR